MNNTELQSLDEALDYLNESIKFTGEYGYTGKLTNAKIEGIGITVDDNDDETVFQFLERDLPVIKKTYKKFFNNEFKKWLKVSEKEFKDTKLYAIEYRYNKSSDTSKFEFDYEYHYIDNTGKVSKYTYPVAMGLKVYNGIVEKESFYDI